MKLPWNKAESDLELEVQYHLDALAEQFERQGMTRAQALRRARIEFGGAEPVKEQCRDESRWASLGALRQDLSFGARMLRKTPVVTLAAVISLALGIGANTAILSLMNALLWKTLDLPQPEQISFVLWQSKGDTDVYRGSSGSNYRDGALQVADYFSSQSFRQMRERATGRAEIAMYVGEEQVSVSYGSVSTVARERAVGGNFFPLLRARPQLGRLLTETDDGPAAEPAIVVTHEFWQTALGGDPGIAGKALRMNNRPYTIAGVLPRGFTGLYIGDPTEVYTPMQHGSEISKPGSFRQRRFDDPMAWIHQLVARRAPGVSGEELKEILQPVFQASWAVQPKTLENAPVLRIADGSRGESGLRRNYGNPLYVLLALVALVLLVACANIANLLLARSEARRSEAALRVALGCSRSRLVRQFLTESALLAALGGLLSLGVASVTAALLARLGPVGDARLQVGLDLPSLLAAFAITACTALVFGLYPAWRSSRVNAAPELKEGSGNVGAAGRSRWTAGKLLVGAQVALGVLLVTAAMVFTGHFRELAGRDTGFDRARLLLFDLRPGESGWEGPRLRQFYETLEGKLRDTPGVLGVGLARTRPIRGGGYWDAIGAVGVAKPIRTAIHHVNAGFMDAMGIGIVAGRGLTEQEVRTKAPVAVVSEDLARELGGSPLGMRIWHDKERPMEVVGVAKSARYARVTERPNVTYETHGFGDDSATVVLRTATSPLGMLPAVRQAIQEIDARLPLVRPVSMDQQISTTLWRERMFAWLCGSFGVLALVLCVVGLYGVVSYSASRRSHEIGIRMAVGASREDVLRQVLREGMLLAAAGFAVGAPAAYWASGALKSLRFGIDGVPVAALGWSLSTLAVAAFVAVLIPAVRASGADPARALRQG